MGYCSKTVPFAKDWSAKRFSNKFYFFKTILNVIIGFETVYFNFGMVDACSKKLSISSTVF